MGDTARAVLPDSAHVAGVPLSQGYPRHTLPEGFFLQVFLSAQALLLGFSGYWNGTVELVLCLIFMYITYRQLFGYGWWGTLWRFAVVVLVPICGHYDCYLDGDLFLRL